MEELLQEGSRYCKPIKGLKDICKFIPGFNYKPVNFF
jgi:hypothetical protein